MKDVTLTQDATDKTKYTFTMPAGNVTVDAAFELGHTHTVDGQTISFTPWDSTDSCRFSSQA